MGTFAVPAQEKRKKMVKTIVTGKDNLKQAFQASKLLFHNITLLKKTNNQKKNIFFSNQIRNNPNFKNYFIIRSKDINIVTKNVKMLYILSY